MADFSETDLAYAAGIIDGEGSIGITELAVNNAKRKSPAISGYVSLAMSDDRIPKWFAKTFGGTSHSYASRGDNHKGMTHWRIQGQRCVEFCELLLPYLKLKNTQAQIIVAFYTDSRFVFKQRRGIPQEEIEARREYVTTIQSLNKRGT